MQQLRLKQQDRIHENCIWFYTETNPKHKNQKKILHTNLDLNIHMFHPVGAASYHFLFPETRLNPGYGSKDF